MRSASPTSPTLALHQPSHRSRVSSRTSSCSGTASIRRRRCTGSSPRRRRTRSGAESTIVTGDPSSRCGYPAGIGYLAQSIAPVSSYSASTIGSARRPRRLGSLVNLNDEWELVLPSRHDTAAVEPSLREDGHDTEHDATDWFSRSVAHASAASWQAKELRVQIG